MTPPRAVLRRWSRAVFALPLLAGISPVAAAQQDTSYVELLVDLRIDRGPSDIAFALAGDSVLLLATGALLQLGEVRVTDVIPPRYLRGLLEPSGEIFRFDTDSGLVHVGRRTLPLPPGRAVWRDGELYVDLPILSEVFGVHLRANRAELTVQVLQTEHLPVVRRIQRARRREAVRRFTQPPPPALDVTPPPSLADGAVFDWAVTTVTQDPLDASSLDLGIGALVLGGSAVLEHTERLTATGGERDTRGSWIRGWHANPYLRQLRLGDVLGTGRIGRLVRGVAVTNAPFLRPASFGSAELLGAFDDGWEVELYRFGQLAGFTTAEPGGRFRFDLPIKYGPNPLEIVGYGPRGEVVRRERTFEVSPLRLPGRRLEYGAAVGSCTFDPCDAALNLDLRYGISDAVTARAGFDRFWRDTLPHVSHPYVTISGQPTRSVALTAEGVLNALLSARIDIAPTPDFQAGLAHTRFDNDVAVPLVGSSSEESRTEASLFLRPGIMDDRLFLRLNGLVIRGLTRDREIVRVTATSRFLGTRIDLGARYEGVTNSPNPREELFGVDARFFHVYTGPYSWLRRTLILGAIDVVTDAGVTSAGLSVSRPFGDFLQVDLGVEWQQQFGATFELGITAALAAVRAVSRNVFDPGDGVRGSQTAEGSLLWERRGRRITPADGRSLGRAGLTGVVFFDANGNGRQDVGDEPMPGIRLQVGPRLVESDSAGRFAVWDLVPFEMITVEIDTLSNPDPLRLPTAKRFAFRAVPNTFTPLPLPFVQAGEVTGIVRDATSGRGIGGARITLRNTATGDEYHATTFSDGSFYVLGVLSGDYEAVVDDDVLQRLNGRAEAAPFTVGRSPAETIIDGVAILIIRD